MLYSTALRRSTWTLITVLTVAQLACSGSSSSLAEVQSASSKSTLAMERFEGSSIRTELSPSIVLNGGSGLKREWFVVRDPSAPAAVNGTAGITVVYKPGERFSSGEYQYRFDYTVEMSEPLSAVEVRVQVFDIFGRHLKTLSTTEIADMNGKVALSGGWRIFSENEASEAYSSVAYVAQARTVSGKVYVISTPPLLEQLKKVTARITEADIEPKRSEK